MHFIQIGNHGINLHNVAYVVFAQGQVTVVFTGLENLRVVFTDPEHIATLRSVVSP